jgi:hypothetical protein
LDGGWRLLKVRSIAAQNKVVGCDNVFGCRRLKIVGDEVAVGLIVGPEIARQCTGLCVRDKTKAIFLKQFCSTMANSPAFHSSAADSSDFRRRDKRYCGGENFRA